MVLGVALVAALPVGERQAEAATAVNLRGRVLIDGSTRDYTAGETVFGINDSLGLPEESDVDSRWQDNDISELYVTWDADSVYLAGDGVINGNNMILFFDVLPAGLSQMTQLNSWRRNFVFANGFVPDYILATWDGNTTPRWLTVTGPNNVTDEVPAGASGGTGQFRAAASFQGTQAGRCMEAAIPWWKLLGYTSPQVYADAGGRRYVPELGDTISVLPAGIRVLRMAGAITAGGDGTGGPDSAPDNLQGHEVDSGVQVTIDNFAILSLDDKNDVTGAMQPDGLPDFGIEPKDRLRFLVRPPVLSIRFSIVDFKFSRPSFAPEKGQDVTWQFNLDPRLDPRNSQLRRAVFSAGIYDMHGKLVKQLYRKGDPGNPPRPVDQPVAPALDRWDGRDSDGRIVDGGIYILRLILEPDQGRLTRALAVVR